VNLALFPPPNIREAKMDHEALRLLIQRKVRDGHLPHDSVTRVWSSPAIRRRVSTATQSFRKNSFNNMSRFWAGPADGEVCDACDKAVTKQQLEIEGFKDRPKDK
jgi:hypothetical protein